MAKLRILGGALAGITTFACTAALISNAILLLERGSAVQVLWLTAAGFTACLATVTMVALRRGVGHVPAIMSFALCAAAYLFAKPSSSVGRVRAESIAAAADVRALTPTQLHAAILPIDPFSIDHSRLRLGGDNGRWIVWSVGPDGIDNGGRVIVDQGALRHVAEDTLLLRVPFIRTRYWRNAWHGDLVWAIRETSTGLAVSDERAVPRRDR